MQSLGIFELHNDTHRPKFLRFSYLHFYAVGYLSEDDPPSSKTNTVLYYNRVFVICLIRHHARNFRYCSAIKNKRTKIEHRETGNTHMVRFERK